MNHDAAMEQVRQFQRQAEEVRQSAVRTSRMVSLVMGAACALGSVAMLTVVALGRVPPQSLFGAGLLAFFAVMILRTARSLHRPEHLRTEGIAAVGVFERVVGSGVNIEVSSSSMEGNVMQSRLRLMIEGDGRYARPVEVTDVVPVGMYGRLVPGTRFRVFVDRRNPDRVLIDWNAAV